MLKGIAAAPGIAIAKAHIFANDIETVPKYYITVKEIPVHIKRLETANEDTKRDIKKIQKTLFSQLKKEQADIIAAIVPGYFHRCSFGGMTHRNPNGSSPAFQSWWASLGGMYTTSPGETSTSSWPMRTRPRPLRMYTP